MPSPDKLFSPFKEEMLYEQVALLEPDLGLFIIKLWHSRGKLKLALQWSWLYIQKIPYLAHDIIAFWLDLEEITIAEELSYFTISLYPDYASTVGALWYTVGHIEKAEIFSLFGYWKRKKLTLEGVAPEETLAN